VSEMDGGVPSVAIGTIPADKLIAENMRETLEQLFQKQQKGGGLLLEMAYKPAVTDLMRLAEGAGWRTIPGRDALIGQGIYQVRFVIFRSHLGCLVEMWSRGAFLITVLTWTHSLNIGLASRLCMRMLGYVERRIFPAPPLFLACDSQY